MVVILYIRHEFQAIVTCFQIVKPVFKASQNIFILLVFEVIILAERIPE